MAHTSEVSSDGSELPPRELLPQVQPGEQLAATIKHLLGEHNSSMPKVYTLVEERAREGRREEPKGGPHCSWPCSRTKE